MNKKKGKTSSINDKINELLAPRNLLDPEYNSDDETVAKIRHYDSEDEQQPTAELSHIRKKNVRMLQDVDAKYRGKISTRHSSDYEESSESETETGDFSMALKELQSDDEISENDVLSEQSKDIESYSGAEEDQQIADDPEDEDEGNDSEELSGDESDFDGGDIIPQKGDEEEDQEDEDDDMEDNDTETQNDGRQQLQINKDVQKGVSIQNQLHIWEKLLEIRIHSQKMLSKANSLPQADNFEQLTSLTELNEQVQKTSKNVENLLTKMCTLQKVLVNQYPEMKEVAEKRKRTDFSDETDIIHKFGKKLQSDFSDFKDYRNETISKWYDRTKVLTPGAKSLKQAEFDIIRNIEGALSNKNDMIKKTQLYRGGYKIIGKDNTTSNGKLDAPSTDPLNADSEPVYISDIYDDTDFYHAQLRELIEFKTNTSSNPAEMTKQFVELQKLRNKIKKVVDTRASKGRKIRYAVHNKMANFMGRHDPSEWTDEAKTELFSSLFGSRTG